MSSLRALGYSDAMCEVVRRHGRMLLAELMARGPFPLLDLLVLLVVLGKGRLLRWSFASQLPLWFESISELVAFVLIVSHMCGSYFAIDRPARLCMMGARATGKTTIGRFLQSGLSVGPVFSPRGSADPSEFLIASGPAAPARLSTLEEEFVDSSGGSVDAARLHALRLGDDLDGAILPGSSEADAPLPRWHAGACALLPDPTASLLASVPASLARSLARCLQMLERKLWWQALPTQALLDRQDGFVLVCRRPTAPLSERDEPWHAAKDRRAFERLCRAASTASRLGACNRPLLVVCSKSDHASGEECRAAVETLCARIGIHHAIAGPRYFVYATSTPRAGPLYLPMELRMRIFTQAIAGGAQDAASGRTLRLESGAPLRVVSAGVIGRASAGRLVDNIAWLSRESRVRRAAATWRAELTLRLSARVASLIWATALGIVIFNANNDAGRLRPPRDSTHFSSAAGVCETERLDGVTGSCAKRVLADTWWHPRGLSGTSD